MVLCVPPALSLTAAAFPPGMKQMAVSLVEHQKDELACTGPLYGKSVRMEPPLCRTVSRVEPRRARV